MTKLLLRIPGTVTAIITRRLRIGLVAAVLSALLTPSFISMSQQRALNPAPKAKDWSDLGRLPDWSGIWTPDIADQRSQEEQNKTPWTSEAAKKIAGMIAARDAGHPAGIFNDCLPEGMPTWMLISHNALEFLFTPGRVTMLGESDGNRLRRVYTDGRQHPNDPDLTYHGNSIGRWENDALVIDTVGILPEVYLAISEAVGVRNGGDVHVVERLHLVGPNTLHDDLEIWAPHVLTASWKTTRVYFRHRERDFDIVEGECLQGSYVDRVDEHGNGIFVPAPRESPK
jgi:hypothetical protein